MQHPIWGALACYLCLSVCSAAFRAKRENYGLGMPLLSPPPAEFVITVRVPSTCQPSGSNFIRKLSGVPWHLPIETCHGILADLSGDGFLGGWETLDEGSRGVSFCTQVWNVIISKPNCGLSTTPIFSCLFRRGELRMHIYTHVHMHMAERHFSGQ